MSARILVLGGTGMLGLPVVHYLADKGHRIRILTRNVVKTRNLFGDSVEILQGTATEFRCVLALAAHVYQVALLAGVVMFLLIAATGRLDPAMSPAIAMDEEMRFSVIYLVLSRLNPFSLWMLGLFVIGVREVSGTSLGRAALTVVVPWLLYATLAVCMGLLSTGM